MLSVPIFISNGADTDRYRDHANQVVRSLQHMFTYEVGAPVTFTNWDYRQDIPAVIPSGTLSSRSLLMVERSDLLIAILGPTVPRITSKEIRKAFERRSIGERCDVYLFLNPKQKTDRHRTFLNGIKRDFHEEVQYSTYTTPMDFQRTLMMAVTTYVLKKSGFGAIT